MNKHIIKNDIIPPISNGSHHLFLFSIFSLVLKIAPIPKIAIAIIGKISIVILSYL